MLVDKQWDFGIRNVTLMVHLLQHRALALQFFLFPFNLGGAFSALPVPLNLLLVWNVSGVGLGDTILLLQRQEGRFRRFSRLLERNDDYQRPLLPRYCL